MSKVADKTAKKQPTGNPFKPGQSGNPKGRPKGARSKLSSDFINAIAADFQKHGIEAIELTREDKPSEYLKIVASLLPKEIKLDADITDATQYSDTERLTRLAFLLGLKQERGVGQVPEGSDSDMVSDTRTAEPGVKH